MNKIILKKEIKFTKRHLLVKRAKIIKFLYSEGYSGQDIGIILNINRSSVSRVLRSEKKYKKSIKNLLKD